MRHSAPFIKDVVKEAHQRGSRHFIGIPMAPHYSTVSVGGYRTALKEVIQELNDQTDLTFIENWHLNPNLLETWKILIEDQLASTKGDYHVLFTAHSIPQKYISAGDPYRKQIEETASRLLKIFRIKNWSIAYQSASSMGESWIGPTVEEELIRIAKAGLTQVLLTPIGFVSDHLEILYDLDIEAVGSGRKLGLEVRRTGMPNCITPFISALESLAINDLGGRIPQKSLHGD
jgi:ferrochelatase